MLQELGQNEKQINTLNDYRNKYKKVIEGLEVYPLSVSENCMVPIGKRALMKGKLIHTNEILVYLGDGYFAKYSASQAISLCNRRIACINFIYLFCHFILNIISITHCIFLFQGQIKC